MPRTVPTPATRDLDPDVIAAIQAIVVYNWHDEEADYHQQDAEGRTHHIFSSLTRVSTWLDSLPPVPPTSHRGSP